MALNLPSLTDQPKQACPKGKTRLEARVDAKPLMTVDEKAFDKAVWHRDRKRCRCCGRKVIRSMERVPERGEKHHLHGRIGPLRFESRAAILSCLTCHEAMQRGRVLVSGPTWELQTKQGIRTVLDANQPLTFTRR